MVLPNEEQCARTAVVLVRTQEEGNLGAVARAMANMGLSRLVLVEPAVAAGPLARAMAVRAVGILEGAERVASLAEALRPFSRAVGTTSLRGRDRQPLPVSPRLLAQQLAEAPWEDTAFVFGPETSGLTTEELALCSKLVSVPTASEMPVLNLAQAVLLVTYEFFLAREGLASSNVQTPHESGRVDEHRPAAIGQVDGLFAQMEGVLAEVGFARDSTLEGVLIDLRRLAARSELTLREVAILRGICRRTSHALELARGETPRRGGRARVPEP